MSAIKGDSWHKGYSEKRKKSKLLRISFKEVRVNGYAKKVTDSLAKKFGKMCEEKYRPWQVY